MTLFNCCWISGIYFVSNLEHNRDYLLIFYKDKLDVNFKYN